MSRDDSNLGRLMRVLDDLAEAAASGQVNRYRQTLDEARFAGATEEQILDAYRWGRRHLGHASFDHHGHL